MKGECNDTCGYFGDILFLKNLATLKLKTQTEATFTYKFN